jgi:RNA polymerase sigma factor for flagellar operon FliA
VDSLKNTDLVPADPAMLFANLADVAIGLAMGFVLEDSGMYQQDMNATYADNTYQRIELQQLRSRIEQAVKSLSGNEKRVISHHYLQHLAFDEIAQVLGLSKGRVSQIHKAALQQLSEKLMRDGNLDLMC